MFKAGDLVKLRADIDVSAWSKEPAKIVQNPPFKLKNVEDNGYVEIAYPAPTALGTSSFFLLGITVELFIPTCQCDLQKLIAHGCRCGAFLAEKK